MYREHHLYHTAREHHLYHTTDELPTDTVVIKSLIKMKSKNSHTVGSVPKSNGKIVERKIDTLTHKNDG
jgi:hypothetical protein